jgi:metal binding Ada-like protein
MRYWMLIAIVGTALALAGHGGGVAAQPAPGQPPASAPPVVHHGLFGRRHSSVTAGSRAPFAGAIIGNKRTHVYHLPGEKGSLPAEKNRVYFHSVAEATAAGYHPAGQHRTGSMGRHPHTTGLHAPSGKS